MNIVCDNTTILLIMNVLSVSNQNEPIKRPIGLKALIPAPWVLLDVQYYLNLLYRSTFIHL